MSYEALWEENQLLKQELAQLKKLIFGSKSERFVPTPINVNQISLFEDQEVEIVDPIEEEKTITYERKVSKKHEGRNEIPSHLPVEEYIIEPQEDTTGLVKIGEEVTETLEYTPASLIKKITRRPKYAHPDGNGILIGALPSRPIDKGIAEASLLAHIFVSKFCDHLPFYRQIQMFKRDYDWNVSDSTMNDWYASCYTLLDPLYQHMRRRALTSRYLQVDESPIKVLDSDKPSGTHQGYQWVYHSPSERIIFFDYRKGRGMHGPKEVLSDYNGYLQNDGYTVYDKIGQSSPDITLVGCTVHARRYFTEARDNDKKRADYILEIFQKIYQVESDIKSLTSKEKQAQRLEKIKPLYNQIIEYIKQENVYVQPKSPIGKAMTYFQNQWPKLQNIFLDSMLELDNNLIENKIRPLALGRKNYLFAGNHTGADRIAMMYTFMATCKANDVNPRAWLEHVLKNIKDTKLSELHTLYPQNYNL
jgi:transposase